jgi:dolichol-phosphate mannosyltransferase
MPNPRPDISIVVPVMNEAENVSALAAEISTAMNATKYAWECVWVDDGSTDTTWNELTALVARDEHHRALAHDRNYGQSAALSVGFRAARGRVFAMLDGDGQNDPADVPRLMARLEQGDVDMVNGVRAKRRDSFVRRACSRIANRVRSMVLHDGVTDVGCSMRVFKRECVDNVPVFRGLHRFLPGLAAMRGYRITETSVNHRPRTRGVTKYGIGNRLWVGLADMYGVLWVKRRFVYPHVRECLPAEPESGQSRT